MWLFSAFYIIFIGGIKYYEVVVGSEKYKISDKNCCKGTYSITSSSGKGMTAAVYSGCCDSDMFATSF